MEGREQREEQGQPSAWPKTARIDGHFSHFTLKDLLGGNERRQWKSNFSLV